MAILYGASFVAEELTQSLADHEIPFHWLKDNASKRLSSRGDQVSVMTLHSSKGLEFPIVAIAGLGFMPNPNLPEMDEARLLYVGMTRATNELLMTASRDSVFAKKLLIEQPA